MQNCRIQIVNVNRILSDVVREVVRLPKAEVEATLMRFELRLTEEETKRLHGVLLGDGTMGKRSNATVLSSAFESQGTCGGISR